MPQNSNLEVTGRSASEDMQLLLEQLINGLTSGIHALIAL
jgi:hypothetical protein